MKCKHCGMEHDCVGDVLVSDALDVPRYTWEQLAFASGARSPHQLVGGLLNALRNAETGVSVRAAIRVKNVGKVGARVALAVAQWMVGERRFGRWPLAARDPKPKLWAIEAHSEAEAGDIAGELARRMEGA